MAESTWRKVVSWEYFKLIASLVFKQPFREIRLLGRHNASAYYTHLGDDVLDLKNNHFRDPQKPLWLSLGYWKTATTYPDACADLARYLAETADLQSTDEVLDVGFGFGEQDILWAREYQPKRIVGINITPIHVQVARQRVEQAHLEEKIELHVASATELPFPDECFDKVVVLEAAFHFDTREKFFSEAFRVMRPGGLMALTDMLPRSGQRHGGIFRRIVRKRAGVPEANMYDQQTYKRKLGNHGFSEVEIESIGNYVFPGMAQYAEQRYRGQSLSSVKLELANDDFDEEKWNAPWKRTAGIEDYVMVRARKPFENTTQTSSPISDP